jgi:hypothetical protein
MSWWIQIILAIGNPIKVGLKQNDKSKHDTLLFDNNFPFKDWRKLPFHFGFQSALLGSSSMNNIWSSFP